MNAGFSKGSGAAFQNVFTIRHGSTKPEVFDMKLIARLSSLAVGGMLLLGNPAFAGDSRGAAGEGQWLSIGQIHDKLEAAGYRRIEKIERERGGYEARATDRNGERIKLHLNPQTGEVIDQRARKHGHGDRDDRDGRRDSADCNKRRCRDDLPPKAAVTAPAAR